VAQTVCIPELDELSKKIARKLALAGPWNVQLMGQGSFKLVEVNPRVVGSMPLVIASGLKYLDLLIKIFTGEKISADELTYHSGVIMTRYNEEIFLNPDAVISLA
jgi:biotin carboxylase